MVSNHYTYVLTDKYEADIDEIVDYIANELYSPSAASDFVDELDQKLEEICKTPKAGRLVDNPYLKRDDVRRVLVKSYTAYYLIDVGEQQIVVLRVVYSRRDQNKILRTL